jgi:predicted O-methyltransferase YrrM
MLEIPLIAHLNPALQNFLKNMKISGEERSVPNISWSTAEEITQHIQSIPVENILEIGPANGFSTMMMSL